MPRLIERILKFDVPAATSRAISSLATEWSLWEQKVRAALGTEWSLWQERFRSILGTESSLWSILTNPALQARLGTEWSLWQDRMRQLFGTEWSLWEERLRSALGTERSLWREWSVWGEKPLWLLPTRSLAVAIRSFSQADLIIVCPACGGEGDLDPNRWLARPNLGQPGEWLEYRGAAGRQQCSMCEGKGAILSGDWQAWEGEGYLLLRRVGSTPLALLSPKPEAGLAAAAPITFTRVVA